MKIKINIMVTNARKAIYFEISNEKRQRILDFTLTPEQFTRILSNSEASKIEADYYPLGIGE